MDEFYALAKQHKVAGEYAQGAVFDSCENIVNNLLHGRSFGETAQLTRAALVRNAQVSSLTAEQRATYAEAVEVLDQFVTAWTSA